MMKFQKPKKSKIIPKKELPIMIYSICSLNDGRLAIGGYKKLVIYNMKTYRVDIQIGLIDSQEVKFSLQLKDNSLFYYTYDHSSEGPWTDEYFKNYLIELSDKSYVDKTKMLPADSRYNILREHSDNILFGGISYEGKSESYHSTNASGPKRIEKLVKNMEEPKEPENKTDDNENLKGKFNIDSSINIDFEDFALPNNNLLAVLTFDNLIFYQSKDFKKISSTKITDGEKIAIYNDNLLLIATLTSVVIFDYKNLKTVKNIFCAYPYKIILVNQPRVFIGETNQYDNRITEYEIDNDGKYKQISTPLEAFKSELTGLTLVKDGRLISSTKNDVRIWS